MATHSTAYIPTNRAPGEYLMSEGWSDGMLSHVGLAWYGSTPRLNEAIAATMLLGGSPVFAPAGTTTFDVKEIDYISEGVSDMLDDDAIVDSVETTLDALTNGDMALARSTPYGQMTLEQKMAADITLNTSLHTIHDFSDVPDWGIAPRPYNAQQLQAYVAANDGTLKTGLYVSTVYLYHPQRKQWWGIVELSDSTTMWLPLIVAFTIEGYELDAVLQLHQDYPDVYAVDIAELAAFRQTAP